MPYQQPIDRLLEFIDRVARLIIIVAVSGMIVLVATQVFARYVLNSSIGWADEVSRLFFVWSIFLAIPLGLRRGSHIGIELATARLPIAAQRALARSVSAVAALLTIVVAWQSLSIAVAQWDELMVSVDISSGFFLLALGLGSLHAALHLVRMTAFGSYSRPPPA